LAAGGESVVREFLKSPKAADARPETTKELAVSSRGELDSAAVLGEFLESPNRDPNEVVN